MRKFNVETEDRPVDGATIGGKWHLNASIPLPPQRSAGPLDKDLQVHGQMTTAHGLKQVPPWATQKAAPHFGKTGGLAPGSWKQFKNYVPYF